MQNLVYGMPVKSTPGSTAKLDPSASQPEAPARARKPRPGGRTQQVGDRIFQVAITLLERDGYAGLTFQNVAEAAGIARSTLYRRWPSRGQLALEAIDALVRENVIIADTGSLEGDLRETLHQVRNFITSPLGATVMAAGLEIRQAGEHPAPAGLRWAQRAADVAPIFDRAIARGELPAGFDWEITFAQAAGALYFRMLVMAQPIEPAWIDRVVSDVIARTAKVRPPA